MISLVTATEKNLPQVLEIFQEAISPSWTHKALLSEISKGDSHFIVAVDESKGCDATGFPLIVVGFAVLRQVGDDGELLQIAVEKSSRGRGVGDLLIDSVLDYAAENAFNSVFLEVRCSNTAAVSLYKKHGFESVRIRKDYYNSPVEDALVMVKITAID